MPRAPLQFKKQRSCRSWLTVLGLLSGLALPGLISAAEPEVDAVQLARAVTIHRDEYGVPHIFGETDESTIFGFGYAQAEDFFWQVEDAYILALGRYAEVHGPKGINSDLLNRAFEVVPRSRRDFELLDPATKQLCAVFVAGINHYLNSHPDVHPRLIKQFQPWHVLAYCRHIALELTYRLTGLTQDFFPRRNPCVWTASGSNGWVVGGQRTATGNPMLLANPHLPWFGFAQLMEAHLHSEGGNGRQPWNFIGAGFYGSPTLALGHNERLGWTLVSNEPDIADTWKVRFSDPERPLAYEFDKGFRLAESWRETLLVRKNHGLDTREFQFRKTHHGPIVAQHSDGTLLSAQISGVFESIPFRQALRMMQARDLSEFREAVGLMQILFMNVLYGDCDGNTWFVYMGRVPRRDPKYDWSQPVDGSDPAAVWLGVHSLDELPQVLNPAAGFVQNCNSSPLITTDGDNPRLERFPPYMIGDVNMLRRRALRSLEILRSMNSATLDDLQAASFDTEVYWARHELPKYAKLFQQLESEQPGLARRVQPYLEHLLAWDARITADSTAATLCHHWYEQLYGLGYPGEQMRERYLGAPDKQLELLARAAERLEAIHGSWKVPYGEIYRSQRVDGLVDLLEARFDDESPSLPAIAGHGPMGSIFTEYYTPSIEIPWVISQRCRYGLVGTSYLATYEFTPTGVQGASLVPYGTSGDPDSSHYDDQARLLAEQKFKPEHFTKAQVLEAAVRSYHPGEEIEAAPR